MSHRTLSWLDIVRLGLVQTALGSIVVLTTSTLNRVMVVELALPAMVPGVLIGLHYAVQMSRPRWGYGSDIGGRRTPWIIGGIATLGCGGWLAAATVGLYAAQPTVASALAIIAFLMIGAGVGAAGTSLLALLSTHVAPRRRPGAAATVWLMMIAGFIVTSIVVGHMLDPYSHARLSGIAASVATIALAVTIAALWGLERKFVTSQAGIATAGMATPNPGTPAKQPFRAAIAEIWSEPQARRFTVFVFVSMLAFSAQDLILEPFAGLVFAMTPGETTKLSGTQHAGVFAGMIMTGALGYWLGGNAREVMRSFTIAGCLLSCIALLLLAIAGAVGPGWPLSQTVFGLGFANGMFAVAAIGSMMTLAGEGRSNREGTRIGLWGAAQAIAFGLGGFLGTVAVDLARSMVATPAVAYSSVFVAEGLLFLLSAVLAVRVSGTTFASLHTHHTDADTAPRIYAGE